MTSPVRIQRKRAKGFDLKKESRRVNGLECVYVGRPTMWGNPFKLGDEGIHHPSQVVDAYRDIVENLMADWDRHLAYVKAGQQKRVPFHNFCHAYKGHGAPRLDQIHRLRGKNLACWCPLDQPCHADVLLEIANGGSPVKKERELEKTEKTK